MKLLHPQLLQYGYIGGYGVFEPLSPKKACKKLQIRIFAYTHIHIEAEAGG